MHFEKVVCGVPDLPPTPKKKAAMDHGVRNEQNAVATIVGKIIPVVEPSLIFCEEGCVTVRTESDDVFMVVSPDGSLRETASIGSTKVGIEIKCPYYKIHTEFPSRYLLQCLAEIEVLNVEYLFFVSWTEKDTKVFRVTRDTELFKSAVKIAFELYTGDRVTKPTKLREDQKVLLKKISEKSKSISLFGRFQSLLEAANESVFYSLKSDLSEVTEVLSKVVASYEMFYELNRERASEAVVFLATDLDRSWDKTKLRWAPVAWFPKGYSLSTETMREIMEDVHTHCHVHGVHMPCSSFDGQWHGIVVRSKSGRALTLYQLQRDVWKEVEQMSKGAIISELKKINTSPTWSYEFKSENLGVHEVSQRQVIVAPRDSERLPDISGVLRNPNESKASEDENNLHNSSFAEAVPSTVIDAGNSSLTVLEMTNIEEEIVMEAFSGHINEEEWAEKLELIQNEKASDTDRLNKPDTGHDVQQPTHATTKQSQLEQEKSVVSKQDMNCILALLKSSKDCNRRGKWNTVTVDRLMEILNCKEQIQSLLDSELRVIVRYFKKQNRMTVKESSQKHVKVTNLCSFLKLGTVIAKKSTEPRSYRKSIPTLCSCATKVLTKSFTKQQLNVVYSEFIWPDRYTEWVSGFNDILQDGEKYELFYRPELSIERGQYECRCIDSSHLLTRSRRKACKGGLGGFSNEPWVNVATSRKTLLTKVMVEEITDPMSVPMAETHFSKEVEDVMRKNGDTECADLCKDLRNWWFAEDKPGIAPSERIHLRKGLRGRLLSYVNFGKFPPKTQFVQGWPVQLWEALLSHIDAKFLLYSLCHTGTYNVRAFSSMLGDTFFSELVLNDRRGKGTVTCQEFGQFIGSTIEKVQARLDPERQFSHRTSRTRVYNLVEQTSGVQDEIHTVCPVCDHHPEQWPRNIVPRAHQFDTEERRRLKGRKKMNTISVVRTAVQKGSLGVRYDKARINEAKMLPTSRMGIDLTE